MFAVLLYNSEMYFLNIASNSGRRLTVDIPQVHDKI